MNLPSKEQLQQQIIASYETKLKELGHSLPLSSRSVWAVLASVQAMAIHTVYHYGSWVYRQIFPQTQDLPALLLDGERLGLFIKNATATQVQATASGNPGVVLDAGRTATAGGQVFVVQTSVELDELGEATVDLVAAELGALPEPNPFELTLATSVAGMSNKLAITSWLSGSDEEAVNEFRRRVIAMSQTKPQGGAIPDFVLWSLEVAGIARVLVISRQPGFVTVYPLASQLGDDRQPSDAKREGLSKHLNNEATLPLGVASVMVAQFEELSLSVEVGKLEPNTLAIRQNIELAWQQYLWQRFPRQLLLENEPTHQVSLARMIALGVAAGANELEISLRLAGQSVQVYELAYNQIIELGGITWN